MRYKETSREFIRRVERLAGMGYEDIPFGEEGDAILPILARWDHPNEWKYTEYLVQGPIGPLLCRVYQK